MEEGDTGGTEPLDLRRAEQAELLSLIISGEEEATREDSDLGDGERLANGHAEKNSDLITGGTSPATSYWSITEGPDHPLLISISPGKVRAPRGSRHSISRIPGRDHRRYYHEYWRSEYLMDFDLQRQSMVCMVCGSSLATLKLSTIKRHIRQKHPESLLWTSADKEVIRSGWDSHLSVSGDQPSFTAPEEELLMASEPVTEADGMTPQVDLPEDLSQELSQQALSPAPSPEKEAIQLEQQSLADPLAQTLERYLNNSLHAWFRQEFLMKYDGEAGRLQCMVCGDELPSLHLEHIKRHMLDTHPNSLVYSSQEKHCVLQAWAETHEDSEDPINSETTTKEFEDCFSQDEKTIQVKPDLHQEEDGSSTQDPCLIGVNGEIDTPQRAPPPQAPRQRTRKPRKARLRGGNPWRLRLDYLVAYGPQGKGTYCMVCSEILHETKVSSFRRHIQEAHPETTTLSKEEREAMAAAWTKDYSTDPQEGEEDQQQWLSSCGTGTTGGTPGVSGEIIQGSAGVLVPDGTNENSSPDGPGAGKRLKQEEDVPTEGSGQAVPPRLTHYPGKDQRRNYQSRWRDDYLMDYDYRRHGLICMVCGATLATLKVSTIKRHIQQVHPRSVLYSPAEKQQALDTYAQSDLHFRNTEDCLPLDHMYSDPQIFGT